MKFWQSDTTVLNYTPIIAEAIYDDGCSLQVSDSTRHLTKGDIIVTSAKHKSGSWKLMITDVSYHNDIFETYIILKVRIVTTNGTMWKVKDFIEVGDELKILENAAREN